ncbi:MAG: Asp-tRNA(Asn)/Glu-tRNA(Gln) amidotransferase subunit GatA [Clostridia bacterium]|nr:Asp-tRNA(Asn)/Glu-tRNA(Gln) amidotransferase subunit GatA [Clostridia bacterium]
MDYSKLTLVEILKLIKEKKVTCVELVNYYFDRIKKFKHKNAVLEIFEDALEIAKEKDKFLAVNTEKLPLLFGAPILIKDNILYKGHKCTCASKFLKDYVAQYSSTVVKKLLENGAIIIGRTNMDEFAMGGSTENSAFGVTLNALDDERVPGGSSGGSATSTALGLASFTLGSDTGGSIRQPASFNGVVGLKPTYGRVSRFGLVAFASSLDQIGPIAKTSEDCALILQAISGYDVNDQTTLDVKIDDYKNNLTKDIKGKVFAIPKEILKLMEKNENAPIYQKIMDWFTSQGTTVKQVSIPHYELSLPVYYVLAPAEATSNLGRFDGIKYSTRDESALNIDEVYNLSRTKGFGKEVKRRIMLGNFVLSSGYFDAYYKKAKKIQQLLKEELKSVFEECDALILPTTFGEAFKIGEKSKDPVAMYAEDMFTIFSNLVGAPSISVPCGKGSHKLPLGLQIVGKHFDESNLLNYANYFENNYKEVK